MSLILLMGLLLISGCNGIGTEKDMDLSTEQDREKTETDDAVKERQTQQTVEEAESYINENGTCINDRINVSKDFSHSLLHFLFKKFFNFFSE